MTRITLDNGRWFALDAAECWSEDTYHDGRNFVSRATGDQWEHEYLYRTRGGLWVVYHWSQWQGSRETYTEVSPAAAAAWLVLNDKEIPAELEEHVKAAEV